MRRPTRTQRGRPAAWLAAALLCACAGATPPTAEMRHFQTLQQQADMALVEARYPELVDQANRRFAMAEEANEDDDAEARRHHIHIALARLRTAIALSEQQDALQANGSDESRAMMLEQQLAQVRAQRDELQTAVARIERINDLEGRLARMELEGEQRVAADRARQALDEAMAALNEAERLDADRYALQPMREARRAFEQATTAHENGRYEDAVALAGTAGAQARAAAEQARPEFETAQQRARIDQQIAEVFDAATQIPTVAPRITEEGVVLSLRELFAVGASQVSDPRAPVLERVAALAKRYDALPIVIEGHTDSTGSPTTNLNLSQARASAVMDRLAALGVPRDRMVAVGRGSEEPIATNETAVGRAQNRRVDVVFGRQPLEQGPAASQAAPIAGPETTARQ